MNVVLFIHSLRDGGAERVCSYIANFWMKSGVTVTLVTVALPSHDDYFTNPDIRRISLGLDKKSNGVCDAVLGNYRLVSSLRKILVDNKVDTTVSFMTRSNVICALACIGISKFHIAAERNFSPMDNHGFLWNALRKKTYRFADVVVTQTEIGQRWIEANTNSKRVEVIPNPIIYPLNEVNRPDDLPVESDARFILAVGRLSPQKQFDHLINAFADLPVCMSHWRLYILGEGRERSDLEALVEDRGVADRVSLLGRVDNVALWYERAEIFVLSSKYEGFPNVLAEAMSYGVPAISYACDTGPTELIEHGKSGFLVEPDNINELSARINELANSANLRAHFGQNAKAVRTTYSLDAVMKQWTELLPQ